MCLKGLLGMFYIYSTSYANKRIFEYEGNNGNRQTWSSGKTPPIPAIDKSVLLTLTYALEVTNLMVQLAAQTDKAGSVEVHKLTPYSIDD